MIILKSGAKPQDERWYIQQLLPAIGLSLKALGGTHIDIRYVSAGNLTQAYAMGLATGSGHDLKKCTLTPFRDADGGSGLVLKVVA